MSNLTLTQIAMLRGKCHAIADRWFIDGLLMAPTVSERDWEILWDSALDDVAFATHEAQTGIDPSASALSSLALEAAHEAFVERVEQLNASAMRLVGAA